MKMQILMVIILTILAVLLFPVRHELEDGTGTRYHSLTYEITKWQPVLSAEPESWIHVKVLGFSVYGTEYESSAIAICTRCPSCGKIVDLSQGEICPYCEKK